MSAPNIVIGYHANCMDGFFAAAVTYYAMEKIYNEENVIIAEPVRYGEQEKFLASKNPENTIFFFVDMSISKELFDKYSSTYDITIIDHHKSCNEIFEEDADYGKPTYPHLVRRENRACGAALCVEYFESCDVTFHTNLKEFIFNVVDKYDRWVHNGSEEVESCVLGFYHHLKLFYSKETISTFLLRISAANLGTIYYEAGKYLYMQRALWTDGVIDSMYKVYDEIEDAGHHPPHFKVVYCTDRSYISYLGNAIVKEFGGVAAIISPHPADPYICDVSFRSLQLDEAHDCSLIASSFGGGGHQNAAGASNISLLELLEWLE